MSHNLIVSREINSIYAMKIYSIYEFLFTSYKNNAFISVTANHLRLKNKQVHGKKVNKIIIINTKFNLYNA